MAFYIDSHNVLFEDDVNAAPLEGTTVEEALINLKELVDNVEAGVPDSFPASSVTFEDTVNDPPLEGTTVDEALVNLKALVDGVEAGVPDSFPSENVTFVDPDGNITGENVKDALLSISGDLTDHDTAITGILQRLNDLETTQGNLQGRIELLETGLQEADDRITTLDAVRVEAIQNDVEDLKTRVEALEAAGGGTTPDLTELEGRVTDIENQLNDTVEIKPTLDQLRTDLDEVKATADSAIQKRDMYANNVSFQPPDGMNARLVGDALKELYRKI